MIGEPPFQAVSTANLVPHDIGRLRVQWIFNVNFLLSHTLRVNILLLVRPIFAAKLRKILEIKNIFAKNFGSSGKSSTFAGDFKEITCDDGLHLGKK